MQRTPASSSNIASYGYDATKGMLEVEFHGGRVYHYEGVSAEVFEEFRDSPSLGGFFASRIRPSYQHIPGPYEGHEEPESEPEAPVIDGEAPGVTWGMLVEQGMLAGRLTHPYEPTIPYQGCVSCSCGPGALIHNGYTGRVPEAGGETS